jgi:IS605 OrfB family transposase
VRHGTTASSRGATPEAGQRFLIADHRDAHWAKRVGVNSIGIEDLDFTADKTRERHGRKKRFRQLISGMPTAKLKARIVSMAAEQDLAIVAVDPAYTSMWGGQHWQKSR